MRAAFVGFEDDTPTLLPVIAHERESGYAEKFLKIFRAELRVMIEKEQRASAAGLLRVLDGDLAFPPRVEEIPIARQCFGVD